LTAENDHFPFYRFETEPPEQAADPGELPAPLFVGGEWELDVPGSEGIAPFTLPIRLLPPIQVTNFAEAQKIQRANGAIIRWRPEGYLDGDLIEAYINGPSADGSYPGVSITCHAKASGGVLEVPAALLEQMGSTPASLLMLNTLPSTAESSRFSIELPDGRIAPGSINRYNTVGFPVSLE